MTVNIEFMWRGLDTLISSTNDRCHIIEILLKLALKTYTPVSLFETT